MDLKDYVVKNVIIFGSMESGMSTQINSTSKYLNSKKLGWNLKLHEKKGENDCK